MQVQEQRHRERFGLLGHQVIGGVAIARELEFRAVPVRPGPIWVAQDLGRALVIDEDVLDRARRGDRVKARLRG
jgi:hypothetical protein